MVRLSFIQNGVSSPHGTLYRLIPSVHRQTGKRGLGLDAQRQAVAAFVAEHTEIESTRNRRPELHAALEACRKHKATLFIARLDRLARNVAFISNLTESRVDFVAVDMPEANRLTIHILAAVTEHKREMISKRTKAALRATKAHGTVLGNPNPVPASRQAIAALKARTRQFHATVKPLIQNFASRAIPWPRLRENSTTGIFLRHAAGDGTPPRYAIS
jgi:DNA invertase Pin-like site-specific DNA recombinase